LGGGGRGRRRRDSTKGRKKEVEGMLMEPDQKNCPTNRKRGMPSEIRSSEKGPKIF